MFMPLQGAAADSQEVARESWADLKGDVQHTLPLAQPKLLKGIQLYFAELDVQSKACSAQNLGISVGPLYWAVSNTCFQFPDQDLRSLPFQLIQLLLCLSIILA